MILHFSISTNSLQKKQFLIYTLVYFFTSVTAAAVTHDHNSFMEKRKAFNLKWLLAVYNIFQVATCCYIIYGFLSNEFSIIKFWKCQSIDYKSNRKANSLVIYSYQTLLLKLAELIETVFFVLRKKQNQVSKLHVYHHVSTAILAWCVVKYAAG